MKKRTNDIYTTAFSSLAMRNLIIFLSGLFLVLIASGLFGLFGPVVIFIVIGLFLAVLIFRFPFFGLLLFVSMIPIESVFFSIGSGAITYTRLLGFYILGLWVSRFLIERQSVRIPPFGKWFISFLIWALISSVWAIDSGLVFEYGLTLTQMFVLGLLIFNEVKNFKQLNWILITFMASCLIAALLGYFKSNSLGAQSLLTLESQGVKEYATIVGSVFLSGIIFYTRGYLHIYKILALLAIVICIYPLYAAGERGVFLGLLIGWLAVQVVINRKVGGLAYTLMIGLFMYIAFQGAAQRGWLSDFIVSRYTISNLLETGGTGRANIWKVGLNIIKNHPFIGVGLGNFPLAYLQNAPSIVRGYYAYSALGPHSDFIGLISELGIIGFGLFISLLLSVGKRFVKLFQQPLQPIMAVTVSCIFGLWIYYLTIGLTSILIYRKFYWLLFALVEVTIKIYQEKSDVAGL